MTLEDAITVQRETHDRYTQALQDFISAREKLNDALSAWADATELVVVLRNDGENE